jgi:hypothetical protein
VTLIYVVPSNKKGEGKEGDSEKKSKRMREEERKMSKYREGMKEM